MNESSKIKPETLKAPMQAVVHQLNVAVGDVVAANAELVVLEAMKMHHGLAAVSGGRVVEISVALGDVVDAGQILVRLDPAAQADETQADDAAIDLDHIRADLGELEARLARTLDAARPEKMGKRHEKGFRSARENVNDLCDPDSFIEYGQLVVAAQRQRRELDDLIDNTPADGMVAGFGTINGHDFPEEQARAAVLAYDYTVLAGTQGAFNHKKTDRVLELAQEWQAPIVFFTEGGGGRPGDTDFSKVQGSTLDVMTFATFAKASGVAPRIAINNGYCFAGNAVLFGCADVTIATKNSYIGMGGPAMIEGGGLGVVAPTDVGPSDIQSANGVIDLLAEDEAEAVAMSKKLLGYFQGRIAGHDCADQRKLRHIIPEDRKRAYDMREAIKLIADTDTLLEIRSGYGAGMITAFIRVQGQPFGLIANNPAHLGGAIDAEAAEKAGRFLQLCDAFSLPVLSLCDTPGFMVGPEDEKNATVRRASSMLVAGASLSVPVFMICLRKGYGLGAQAMAMGSFHVPQFTIAWPTGEFGPMGLEGAVRLGYSKELDAAGIEGSAAREALFDKLVSAMYESGKALNVAMYHEIDAVIDPRDTRKWIMNGIRSMPPGKKGGKGKRPFIDTW
ncbi:MAG: Methylmalonyl-CoA carboxyltransferase 12S subunit [Rhodobiaceae bacterium UBA7378]|nr:MAG: Methylmalonyl-CoA carboxyltransferase 12S subunit [Rhodobiaceae bacterium UBA7378]